MTFNWGHKLILVFLLFGGMMAFMVYRSIKTKYDLVSTEYYKDELSYQKIIDGSNEANRLKTKASVVQEGANIVIRMPDEMKNETVKGGSWFYCATDAKKDRKIELKMNKNAEQSLSTNLFIPGNYIVKLNWSSAGRQYYAEQNLIIQ
jgi:hypothetical protein